uniref:Uncharacterized protein n=1 Tax=Vitis vinifera TaxID=29760 RepID=A5B8L8_VITVI|nr:hypothetical protein VITISV_036070 [Vitis vinifera]
MLAAGGEVLLERLPAAGKGGQGVVWQLQELSEQAVRDIWRVRVFQRERGEEKNQSGKLQGIPLAWRAVFHFVARPDVFVGLSLTTPNQFSHENRAVCDAEIDVAKWLLVFEVVSSSFFLFSSLIDQGLKLAINLLNNKGVDEAFRAHINLKALRFGM